MAWVGDRVVVVEQETWILEGNEEERRDEEARIPLKQFNFSNFEVRKPRIKYDAEHH